MSFTPARPPLLTGFAEIASHYEALICDVWGVIHNGVAAFPGAIEALVKFRQGGGRVCLVTNAPRPNAPIHEQLAGFGVPRDAYDDIVTSGDVTRKMLATRGETTLIHIGPERDLTLYDDLHLKLVGDDGDGEILCVTGLDDDTVETPEDYRERLKHLASRGLTLVCANPDIVVERGNQLVWCAGALAKVYEEYGGRVEMLGKPFAPIYAEARTRLEVAADRVIADERILAVGDGLPTDVRGGVAQGLDVLFVTAGIHAADFGPAASPDMDKVAARLAKEGLAARAAIPRLKW